MALSPLTREQCVNITRVFTHVGYSDWFSRARSNREKEFKYSLEEVYLSLATPTSAMALAYPTMQLWWEDIQQGIVEPMSVGGFKGIIPVKRYEGDGLMTGNAGTVYWDFAVTAVPKGISYFGFNKPIYEVLKELTPVARDKPDRMVIESKGDTYVVEGDFTVRKQPPPPVDDQSWALWS